MKTSIKQKEPHYKVGDDMYIPSSMSISHGSDDIVGGLSKISKLKYSRHLPEDHYNYMMVTFEEFPSHSFNFKSLLEKQDELKIQFGNNRAYPNPDIDSPWIEEGDIVNGKVYHGPPQW